MLLLLPSFFVKGVSSKGRNTVYKTFSENCNVTQLVEKKMGTEGFILGGQDAVISTLAYRHLLSTLL